MANLSTKSYTPYENNLINHTNSLPVQNTILHPFAFLGYSADVVAKSTPSREKLNNEKANISTPFNRAFFIRSLRTPKINLVIGLFSMVGRNRQSLTGYVPFLVVSHPVTSYRLNCEKFIGSLFQFRKGLSRMIYKFLCLDREATDFHTQILTINATNEENARFSLNARWRWLATIAKNLPDNLPITLTSAMEVKHV